MAVLDERRGRECHRGPMDVADALVVAVPELNLRVLMKSSP